MMLPDLISVIVRALSFIALFQAAGIAIVIALFGGLFERSSQGIRNVGFVSAVAGIFLVALHYALEAARMAGSLAGVVDWHLQSLVLDSPMSAAAAMRLSGLALIAYALRRDGLVPALLGIIGAGVISVAFTLVGHTADEGRSMWLGAILSLHLLVVAFWFGALVPLHIASRVEPRQTAAQIVEQFSRVATLAVPCLFLLGLVLTFALVNGWAVFTEAYGLLILVKVGTFALLMGLASLNKWRYAPRLVDSDAAVSGFQRAVVAEYLLICIVLIATTVMTTFFSPSH
jgi:copper resistance protein D